MIYEAGMLLFSLMQGMFGLFPVEDLYIVLFVFPALLFLLVIEKNPNKPYAFVTSPKAIWSGVGFAICIATPLMVNPLLYAVWFHQQIIWSDILKNSIYAILNPNWIVIEFHVALSEESIKVALINFMGWRTGKMEARKRQLWMFLVMCGSVGVWAIGHVFFAGYDLEHIIAAFIVGLVWALVVYRLRNFAPAIAGHLLWNIFTLIQVAQSRLTRLQVVGSTVLTVAWLTDLATSQSLFVGIPYHDPSTAELASARFIFLVLGPVLIASVLLMESKKPPNDLLQPPEFSRPNVDVTLPYVR